MTFSLTEAKDHVVDKWSPEEICETVCTVKFIWYFQSHWYWKFLVSRIRNSKISSAILVDMPEED